MSDDHDDRGSEREAATNNKSGQVYGRLKSLIMMQQLPLGTRLEMKMIADKFRVSITPVREALILLAHEGIIGKNGSRSYVTLPLKPGDLVASYETAFVIAKYAIEKNIAAFSTKGLRVDVFSDDAGRDNEMCAHTIALAIENLLERIAGLTNNPQLVWQMQNVNDRTSFVRQLELSHAERREAVCRVMLDWIRALEAGDTEEVTTQFEARFTQCVERLPELVRAANLQALEARNIFDQPDAM